MDTTESYYNRLAFYHSNTRLIRYLDHHCTSTFQPAPLIRVLKIQLHQEKESIHQAL